MEETKSLAAQENEEQLFYLYFPKGYAVRSQLSWTHWRMLLTVQDETARNYYTQFSGLREVRYKKGLN